MFYFKEDSKERSEQVEILKGKLEKKFDKLYKDKNIKHRWSYEHARMCWVSNTFAGFINSDDNSIRGFKTKCTASFTS